MESLLMAARVLIDSEKAGYSVAELEEMLSWWERHNFGRDPYNFDELETSFLGFGEDP